MLIKQNEDTKREEGLGTKDEDLPIKRWGNFPGELSRGKARTASSLDQEDWEPQKECLQENEIHMCLKIMRKILEFSKAAQV